MSKKPKSYTTDDKTDELIKRLSEEVLMTDNDSHVIRYCVKYAASKLLKEK